MAEKVEVEMGGQSKYEVAHRMALNILRNEGKEAKDRRTYFNAVADAIDALTGIRMK